MKQPQFIIVACALVWAGEVNASSNDNIDEWVRQPAYITSNPIHSVRNGKTIESTTVSSYISNPTDPRTGGRKFSVQYPSTWDFDSMEDTSLVMGVKDEDYGEKTGFLRGCFVYVKEIEQKDFSTAAYSIIFRNPDTVDNMVGDDEKLVFSEYTTVDGLPALRIITEGKLEDEEGILYNKSLILKIGYQNTMINLVCGTSGETVIQAKENFEQSTSLFASFLQSFSLLDAHDEWDAVDEQEFADVENVLSFIDQTNLPAKQALEHASVLNANAAKLGGICLNSEIAVQNIKRNPQVVSYTGLLGFHYMWTDGITEYCKEYEKPTKFINIFKDRFAPIQKEILDKIKNIMGAEFTNCLQKDTLWAQAMSQHAIGRVRGRIGVSPEVLCKELIYNDAVMHIMVDKIIISAKQLL